MFDGCYFSFNIDFKGFDSFVKVYCWVLGDVVSVMMYILLLNWGVDFVVGFDVSDL